MRAETGWLEAGGELERVGTGNGSKQRLVILRAQQESVSNAHRATRGMQTQQSLKCPPRGLNDYLARSSGGTGEYILQVG